MRAILPGAITALALAGLACQVAGGIRVSRPAATTPAAANPAATTAAMASPTAPAVSITTPDAPDATANPETPGPPANPPDPDNPYATRYRPGMPYRAGVRTLAGLTLEQARQRLKELGHTGKVTVEEYSGFEFTPPCKAGTVCHRQGGDFSNDDILLVIARAELGIAPPP